MKRIAVAVCLLVSIGYSIQRAADWVRRGVRPPPAEIEVFAEEACRTIPPGARVRIEAPGGRWNNEAHILSSRLHPRVVVDEGRADWVIELPGRVIRKAPP